VIAAVNMVLLVAGTWYQRGETDKRLQRAKDTNRPPRRDEGGRDAEAMLYTARKVIACNTQKGVAAVVPTHELAAFYTPARSTYLDLPLITLQRDVDHHRSELRAPTGTEPW
jgi:hypothetical protein